MPRLASGKQRAAMGTQHPVNFEHGTVKPRIQHKNRLTLFIPFVSDEMSAGIRRCNKRAQLQNNVTLVDIPNDNIKKHLVRDRLNDLSYGCISNDCIVFRMARQVYRSGFSHPHHARQRPHPPHLLWLYLHLATALTHPAGQTSLRDSTFRRSECKADCLLSNYIILAGTVSPRGNSHSSVNPGTKPKSCFSPVNRTSSRNRKKGESSGGTRVSEQ